MDVALESSQREASLALGQGPVVLSEDLGARAHASDLLPSLSGLLSRAHGAPRTGVLPLERVFVGLGPGSYTGLRVGLASALGLARAAGARLYGLPSFEALAYAELLAGEVGTVLLEARAGRFYWGRFHRTHDDVEVLLTPEIVHEDELRARCAEVQVLLAPERCAAMVSRLLPPPAELRLGRARADALLALGRSRVAQNRLQPSAHLEPLYLAEFGA
jgi:tRNA threonylcarbamoyl adenosine modification protein YeaZ